MSAWDVIGLVLWTGLAGLFWWAAATPAPAFAPDDADDSGVGCASAALAFTVLAIYCLCRVLHAHL